MKKLIFYILFTSILGQSTRQVWVLVSFYWNQAEIVENLCINRFEAITVCGGKCYLIKKLGEGEKAPNSAEITHKYQEINWFNPEQTLLSFTFKKPIQAVEHYTYPIFPELFKWNSAIFHPPQYLFQRST